MKYYFLLPLLFLLGCGSSDKPSKLDEWMSPSDKVKVLSTTAMIDNLVDEIGKEQIHHLSLIQGDIDPHSYELVKGDDEKFGCADVVFYNGLGLEHGASLRHRIAAHPKAIPVAEVIKEKRPSALLIKEGQIDPHVWMDISLWLEAIDPIVEGLSSIRPQQAETFQRNGIALKEKMKAAHDAISIELGQIPSSKRYLITSHDAFNYFARAYLAEKEEQNWQSRFAAPEGLAPEVQLSASDIRTILDHIQRYSISVVFSESNVSKDSLKKIIDAASQMGMKVRISGKVLHADALGPEGTDADTYLKMMSHNALTIKEELSVQ